MSDTSDESLAQRLREVIADEPVASFARRCGIGESLLRKYLQGAQPNAQNLILMADAAGVTIDWLAAGRLPRTKRPQKTKITNADHEEQDELFVLSRYRRASPKQKVAIQTLLDALGHR